MIRTGEDEALTKPHRKDLQSVEHPHQGSRMRNPVDFTTKVSVEKGRTAIFGTHHLVPISSTENCTHDNCVFLHENANNPKHAPADFAGGDAKPKPRAKPKGRPDNKAALAQAINANAHGHLARSASSRSGRNNVRFVKSVFSTWRTHGVGRTLSTARKVLADNKYPSTIYQTVKDPRKGNMASLIIECGFEEYIVQSIREDAERRARLEADKLRA